MKDNQRFPSYYQLKKYKAELFPEVTSVSETVAEVNVQSLLNKTAQSIVKISKENQKLENSGHSFDLICKKVCL